MCVYFIFVCMLMRVFLHPVFFTTSVSVCMYVLYVCICMYVCMYTCVYVCDIRVQRRVYMLYMCVC